MARSGSFHVEGGSDNLFGVFLPNRVESLVQEPLFLDQSIFGLLLDAATVLLGNMAVPHLLQGLLHGQLVAQGFFLFVGDKHKLVVFFQGFQLSG